MVCGRSVIRACGDDRWQNSVQEGYQDGISLLEAGLFLLRGNLSVHACMMSVLVKVQPTDFASSRCDEQKGFHGIEAGFGCFAFAWFQVGSAFKQPELMRLIFALVCPDVCANRQQSPLIMPLTVVERIQSPFMCVTLNKAGKDSA